MVEPIVFHAKEVGVAPAGGKEWSMLLSAKNVERRWQSTMARQGEMHTQEEENTWKSFQQKMRTTLFFGFTPYTTTKAVLISITQWRW